MRRQKHDQTNNQIFLEINNFFKLLFYPNAENKNCDKYLLDFRGTEALPVYRGVMFFTWPHEGKNVLSFNLRQCWLTEIDLIS